MLIEPTLLPVWAYLCWGERPAWWTIVGAVIILIGLAVRYIPAREPLAAELGSQ